ncbi:MAG TPA: hypothetical protein VFQ61_18070 [Polyangiaceae bacterium]|nr:hypothetical protein [Polyangiaceae bacterium]
MRGAHNQPLWLNRRLPRNARIEFDAVTQSDEGDLKVEAWGDGRSASTTVSYSNATSYLFIFGGWKNTLHVLARRDEHGPDRAELEVDSSSEDPRQAAVEAGRLYHWVIERADGKTVLFSIDGLELLSLVDDQPLSGQGHEYFAFNNWETPVCFDNLKLQPLP